jgi:hypothetical protein
LHVNVFFERHYFSWRTFYVAIILAVYLPHLPQWRPMLAQ